jgi:hypothetical protein
VDEVMRRILLLALVVLLFPLGGRANAQQSSDPIEIEATMAERDLADADSTDPVEIQPQEEVPLQLTMRNTSDESVTVRYVRLEGKALGLTFLTYDLGVRTTLQPGEQTTLDTNLDFFDLESQATGYLGTSLRVYDPERRLLGSEDFVVDVRGNATSTLGLFAVVVLGVAIFSTTVLVLNTLRRRLPSNRFVRGTQFAIAGGAIGITLALGLAVMRITFADVEAWVPLVFVPTLVAFVVGYIAPGPLSRSIRDVREEEALQIAAQTAVARASGIYDPATSGEFSPGGQWIGSALEHGSSESVGVSRSSSEHRPADDE